MLYCNDLDWCWCCRERVLCNNGARLSDQCAQCWRGGSQCAQTCWRGGRYAGTACLRATINCFRTKAYTCCRADSSTGAGACTYSCATLTCRCIETSRQTNRRVLLAAASLGALWCTIALAMAASADTKPPQHRQLLPAGHSLTRALLATSAVFAALQLAGLQCVRTRSKVGLICYLLLGFTLACVQLGCAAALLSALSGYFTPQSAAGRAAASRWLSLVASAQSDAPTAVWLQSVFEQGQCCGWTSGADSEQNPAYLSCNAAVRTKVCADFLLTTVASTKVRADD
jgi:hypothetical protein